MGRTTGKYQGAVGEICMPRLIVTMPVEQLKRCPDVQKTAEFLQKNMALQDWIMGWDTKPDRLHHPMRFVVDRQISAGAGHSGYPAMATKDWTDSIASGSIIHSGSWGLWHELGHNHQSPPFTMEGQTEVSVNIFSMVCEVMGTGKNFESCWGGGMGPYGMSAEMKKYFSGDQTYNEAPNKVQLFFWVELMYYLGFDAFRQVALQFHDKPYDNGKLSDEKKWEWVMNAFSKVTGKNMGPFFKIWRMPVSERAADRMKDLPVWLPSKDYPACYTAEE
ncbi:M60 family metallopeptidase [Akkermansia massiliensis]